MKRAMQRMAGRGRLELDIARYAETGNSEVGPRAPKLYHLISIRC
jgi:hypothetical protein